MTTIKAIRLASLVTAINVLVASFFSIAAIINPQYQARINARYGPAVRPKAETEQADEEYPNERDVPHCLKTCFNGYFLSLALRPNPRESQRALRTSSQRHE